MNQVANFIANDEILSKQQKVFKFEELEKTAFEK